MDEDPPARPAVPERATDPTSPASWRSYAAPPAPSSPTAPTSSPPTPPSSTTASRPARTPAPPNWEPAWEQPPAPPTRSPLWEQPQERPVRPSIPQQPPESGEAGTGSGRRAAVPPTTPPAKDSPPRHGQDGQRPAPPHPGVAAVPPVTPHSGPATPRSGYAPPARRPSPGPARTTDPFVPTAEEFARRRAARPAEPVATIGVRGAVRRSTLGLVRLGPGRREQELRHDVEMIRRNFGGLRQVTVVNPKGGAGKTVAVLLTAMTFGQKRGGYVLAWDNNETQGTLGMRAQQDFHVRTVRDLLRDLKLFAGSHGRVGDLSQYVRAQGEGMFDVLASDESATAGEMLTAGAFAEIRDVVSRFYKLIFVDTGNNVRAANWQAAIDATDQLVVTMSARNDSAETAARMLDHLEQTGRHRLVRQAVTVVSMPPIRKDIDLPPIQRHFSARTRAVLLAPYERLLDSGEPIRYGQLSSATRSAWLKIAAAVAEGL